MNKENKPLKSSAERLSELENKVDALTESMNGFLDALRTVLMKVADVELSQEQSIKRVSDDLRALKDTLIESVNPQLAEMVREKSIENKVSELTNALEQMKNQGQLLESNGEITEKSFLVLQEFDKSGNIISARTQVLLAGLEEVLQKELLGKKVGETVDLGEGKATVSIQEIYEVANT